MTLSVEQALQRLEKIDWSYDGYENVAGNAYLMREYLTRAALWHTQLNIKKCDPFFDIAAAINKDTQIPSEYTDRLESASPRMPMMVRACYGYMRWVTLDNLGLLKKYHLPDPYEPLIKLFERGGDMIMNAGGGVDINGATIMYSGWPKKSFETMTPIDISDENLFVIDENYRNK